MKKDLNLGPVKKSRIYEEVAERLKKLILEDKLKPGDRLPSERELAEQLRISRPTVSHALRTLENMGFIEIRTGDGCFVKEVSLGPYLQTLGESISTRLASEEGQLLKTLEVRKILEVEIAYLAAERVTDGGLGELRDSLKRQEEAISRKDNKAFLEEDFNFHHLIAKATTNEVMMMVRNSIADLLRGVIYAAARNESSPSPRTLESHREIYEAIEKRDPELARKAMLKHIELTRKDVIAVLRNRS
jgi:GntR family transcriptional repressor for pyruvate dehydrogenase complex